MSARRGGGSTRHSDAAAGQKEDGYRLIQTEADLDAAVGDLEAAPLGQGGLRQVYIDTEFESNRRGTRLCLVQVSTGTTVYLIDPQSIDNLDALGDLLDAEDSEWVLHAGTQDVKLLTEELRLEQPRHLLDTQVAWSLLSAENSVSLAYLQYKLEGVRSSKAHQADDWVRRPLPRSQLSYAASDVLYLPSMTDKLAERAGPERLAIIRTASADALDPKREPPAPLRLESFRNAWQLAPKNQAALRHLIDWYNALPLAERQYVPEQKTLLAVASRAPETVADLGRIKGAGQGFVRRYGASLVDGIHTAVLAAKDEDFVPIDPPPYATFGEIRLEAWLAQLRAGLCVELEISPEFTLPGRIQKRMMAAVQVEGIEGLRESLVGWRRDLLDAALVAFCEKLPPPLDA